MSKRWDMGGTFSLTESEGTFFERNGPALIVGGVGTALFGALLLYVVFGGDGLTARKAAEFTMVKIEPEKKEEPKPEPEPQSEKTEPRPAETAAVSPKQNAPQDAGATFADEGPADGFNLAASTGSGGLTGNGQGGGSYAALIQQRVSQALHDNQRTRSARIEALVVRLWIDGDGRITAAELLESTGNSDLDGTIERDVLVGLNIGRPPPSDMEMPIRTRITLRLAG